MPKLSNVGKVITVGIIAAVVIIFVIIYGSGQGNPSLAANNDASGTSVTAISPTETPGQTPTSTTATKVGSSSPTPPVIHFITPVAGDLWKVGTQEPISWNNQAGVTGSISLINAATKQFVGIVLAQVGPHQMSYNWNTRDIFLDRMNASKKDVAPGTYMVQISFDGNNLKPVTSPAFTITD